MITKDIATAATPREFWHMSQQLVGGKPTRCRRNGKTQTWKTKPGLFRIPVKMGLRHCFYIQNFDDGVDDAPTAPRGQPIGAMRNDHDWCTPELWPAESKLYEGVQP